MHTPDGARAGTHPSAPVSSPRAAFATASCARAWSVPLRPAPPAPAGLRPAAARRVLCLAVALLLGTGTILSHAAPAAAQEPGTAAPRDSADDPAGEARRAAADTGGTTVTPSSGTPRHVPVAPRGRAVRVREGAVEVDGRLTEPVWREAPAATGFVQREPDEGASATQPTEVRLAHDGSTLYVGARMYDERGARGVTARLVRRDSETESDELVLTFDPFHDHVSQTVFSINPAGVRGDGYGPGGSDPDASWDPVWRAETAIDSLGWTAELAIPFSQLRFPREDGAVWGFQITRTVKRLNEESVWSFWREDDQGGPSRFGHLEGMTDIGATTTRLELLPYAVTQLRADETVDADDPFRDRIEPTYRLGADLTYLLTSNLTLNATFNPDFGQVEVDPAVVNLSAFETFFEEKREFFVQGSGRFGFGGLWCFFCSNVSSLDMLFTRRIGRAPQAAFLADDAGEFADVPTATTILGAAKVTGQTSGGTSLGVLAAVTDRETAEVLGPAGRRFDQEVEPLTGYFAGRVEQDFLDGDLQVGGMLTGIAREFDDPALADLLGRHSEAAGMDAEYWWGGRTYHFLFSGAVTNVSGEAPAILRLQESSARYFQRPDREHGGNGLFTDRYDPTLTSMRGWGLYSRVAKDAGAWQWEASVNARSPGFENNDIAFLTRTDYVWMSGNVVRTWTTPGSWYRNIWTTAGGQQEFNFDGDLTSRQLHGYIEVELPFYWEVGGFVIWRPRTFDDRLTRGGPVVRSPERWFAHVFLSTDDRRPVVASLLPEYGWNEEGGSELTLPVEITLRPRSNVSLSLTPQYDRSRSTAQYVGTFEDPTADDFYGRRYVFADLRQESISMTTRLAWTFTPEMSVELFAQPLISANAFSSFKEFAAPRTLDKVVYGEDEGSVRSEGRGRDRIWFIDPDGAGPAEELSFGEPDFVFRSLRSSLIYRWEFAPGSTLFLVWTQDRAADSPVGDLALGRDLEDMWAAEGDNVVLAKVSWWLGL